MEESIGSTLTNKMVTRNRRIRRLRFLVVLRNECENEGGAEKESSIPRSMSRIGRVGCLQRQRSVRVAVAVAERQAVRTGKPSYWLGMGRVSGKCEGHAGQVGHPRYLWWWSDGIVAAGVVPSRPCSLGGWWPDATIPVRRSGSPCGSLVSDGSRYSKCARRCVRGGRASSPRSSGTRWASGSRQSPSNNCTARCVLGPQATCQGSRRSASLARCCHMLRPQRARKAHSRSKCSSEQRWQPDGSLVDKGAKGGPTKLGG
jgi:hypothetical protein